MTDSRVINERSAQQFVGKQLMILPAYVVCVGSFSLLLPILDALDFICAMHRYCDANIPSLHFT